MKDCNSLTFIVRGKLPSSLKNLEIYGCENLEYLWDDNEESCTSVVDEENPNNANTSLLEYLYVSECPYLKCLSSSGHLPQTLHTLSLYSLLELESIAESFHNNKSLEEISAVLEWGLHNLTSLTSLEIWGHPEAESFPQQELEMTFPPSLTDLDISSFPNLKCLMGVGFRNLNSLESLIIFGLPNLTSFLGLALPSSIKTLQIQSCPILKSFSKLGLPSSLSKLEIWYCPEVRSFPEQGLPSSLLFLDIDICPKLKEECKRDKGKKWSKISHIPCVKIDNKYIYDPWEESESMSSTEFHNMIGMSISNSSNLIYIINDFDRRKN
ncbi:hypothetical protein EZV62_009291 [Acer yangbiense]|uniref:NB-ARC domain-containing protein n=1 Tax=Acer yangbiense TaxID=1000413 RepID=A0A5C7IHR8_9ROSI|nr:hypothetical protein EZV62_009291 [Acer yangbiense]